MVKYTRMLLIKLALGFVVIFSLINSIQCVCRGSQDILDAINESNENCQAIHNELNQGFEAILDAINKLTQEVRALKEQIGSSNYISFFYSQPYNEFMLG